MARLSVLLLALATMRPSASEGNTSTETTTETATITTSTALTTTGTTLTETDHGADRRFFFSQTVVFTGFNGTLEQVQMGMSAAFLAALNATTDDQGWSGEALEGLPVQVAELTQRSPTGSQISGVIGRAAQDLPSSVEIVQVPFEILEGALELLGGDFRRLTNSNLFDDELPTFRATVRAVITGSALADEFYDYVRFRVPGGFASMVLLQFEPMAGSRHRQDDPVVAEITTTTTVTTTEHTTTATMTETTTTPSSGSDGSNSLVVVAVLASVAIVLVAVAAVGGALAAKRRKDKASNNQGSIQPDMEAANDMDIDMDMEVATQTVTIEI
jgi:hypothetical protein